MLGLGIRWRFGSSPATRGRSSSTINQKVLDDLLVMSHVRMKPTVMVLDHESALMKHFKTLLAAAGNINPHDVDSLGDGRPVAVVMTTVVFAGTGR